MIRELKEENKKLKQMLKKLAEAGGETVNLAELGLTDMKGVLEDMDENEKIMDDLQKPWEEKLAEEKAKVAEKKAQEIPVADRDTMEESKEIPRSDISRNENTSQDLFNNSGSAQQQ